jgi:hypothetical protein
MERLLLPSLNEKHYRVIAVKRTISEWLGIYACKNLSQLFFYKVNHKQKAEINLHSVN